MNTIIQKAKETHELSRDEIIALLKDDSINEELFKAADEVRKKYLGDEVHLRGLIEFTNICKRNCMYCGLRRDNKNLNRYRLSHEEIIDFAKKAVGYGYKTLVLQGGEDDYYTVERLVPIVKDLKALGVALTLSIGERPFEEYEALKKAGADRFLLRIETTDRELYEELDPGMSHENRIQCLKNLRKLGYEVGSGCLVGLPGQKIESLAGQFELALKVMAIVRLLLPDINIPATTAMETLNKQGRVIALQCGANVVMPNVTEGEYRKLYALYPGKICTGDTPAHCRGCISGKIRGIGRIVSDGPGFRANGFKPKTR